MQAGWSAALVRSPGAAADRLTDASPGTVLLDFFVLGQFIVYAPERRLRELQPHYTV